MAKCFCKWCGTQYSDPRILAINTYRQNPEGGKHAIYEGTEKKEYFCKYCGRKYSEIRTLCINSCKESPSGKHSPALQAGLYDITQYFSPSLCDKPVVV